MSPRVTWVSITLALAYNALAAAAGPEIKAKAVLVPCAAAPSKQGQDSAVHGFLSSKPALTACEKKLGIVLRINNTEQQVEKEDMYVFFDEAVDHDSNESVKLLEPLVVKIYQHPVVLAYGFRYLGSVNGKLAEEVYTVANLSRPESLKACYSNDISAFQCGYDPDELYPKGFCCPCAEDECPADGRQRRCDSAERSPSTHCLRESPYWYSVTALAPAVVYHALEVHVFRKSGPSSWHSVTGPKGVFLSTDNPTSRAGDNGARDYLLVRNHVLGLGDAACSKVGSYFKAFWNQEERCQRQIGSCLELQPLDMWSRDNELRSRGMRTEYLLEGFADPTDDPILLNEKTGRRYLTLRYAGPHLSVAFLEISADSLRRQASDAKQSLSEVSTTASGNPVVIRLYATNTDHSPMVVRAVIHDCSFGFGSASTDQVPLSPGQKLLMLLSLQVEGSMPTTDVWCTVALENDGYRIITSRNVLIRPKGHCLCYLDCQCMCLGELVMCKAESPANRDKRNTNKMPSAAPVRKPTSVMTTSSSHFYKIPEPLYTASATEDAADPLSCGLSITIVILEILLSLGLFKAIVGLASPPVARWGLQNCIAQLEHSRDTDSNGSSTSDAHEKRRVGAGTVFCMNAFCFCMLPFIFCGRKKIYHTKREELEDKIFGFDAASPQRLQGQVVPTSHIRTI
ncbi:hapless 2 isoform X3 [Dermacentor albipictus]|uniref:hapless 2 isoform X3 n=1 Tax=Dermacentor albipictus TaxID=60249 RepID=UPI0031FE00BC